MTNFAGYDENLQIFVLLFERLYGASFAPYDREAIAAAVRDTADQGDGSGRQVFEYALRVAGELGGLEPGKTEAAKQQLRDIFARAWSRGESNERARILAAVHGAIEHSRPGATGVAAMPPASPFRDMPVAPPAPPPPPAPEDPATKVRNAQREAEKAALESNIERMKHEMNMGIINNMR